MEGSGHQSEREPETAVVPREGAPCICDAVIEHSSSL